jgi:hypothetical protein
MNRKHRNMKKCMKEGKHSDKTKERKTV